MSGFDDSLPVAHDAEIVDEPGAGLGDVEIGHALAGFPLLDHGGQVD
jgi:hypothetical protein